jgi:catechol 2,3-dioxygenase-like lactoylglutathione lyase family enzyme
MNLSDSVVSVLLPTSDQARAQEFYEGRLGLPCEGTGPGGELLFRLAGGSQLALRPMAAAYPSANTAMTFEVDDLVAKVSELESRGVQFEDYHLPDLETVDHVYDDGTMKAAWFLDPDGNILCLHERR